MQLIVYKRIGISESLTMFHIHSAIETTIQQVQSRGSPMATIRSVQPDLT